MKLESKSSNGTSAEALYKAAEAGDTNRVAKLLGNGAGPDKRPAGKPTALIAAAQNGHEEVICALIAAGADISFAHGGKTGTTALLEAVRRKQWRAALLLLQSGADVHFDPTGKGDTILRYACVESGRFLREASKKGRLDGRPDLEVIAVLLKKGAKTRPGAIQSAAVAGDLELVDTLLAGGVHVDELNDRSTALSNAVTFAREDVAVELLKRGADPWADKEFSGPVLHKAIVMGLEKVVRAIVLSNCGLDRPGTVSFGETPPLILTEEKDARGRVIGREWKSQDRPRVIGGTALIVAVMDRKPEMVRLLAEGGADLETTDSDGFTPLARALQIKEDKIAAFLRKRGAREPAHLFGSPVAALHSGAADGDLERVRMAVGSGADIHSTRPEERVRRTPLMRAAEAGHAEIVKFLLEAGADPNTTGGELFSFGVSPLMLAARSGHTETVRALLDAGAQVSAQQSSFKRNRLVPDSGDSALHEAAQHGHKEVVRLLIAHGSDPAKRSRQSGDALTAAAQGSKDAAVEVIRGKRALGQRIKPTPEALIAAVGARAADTVRLLLDQGGDPSRADRGGFTPLAAAAADGNAYMVRLLLKAGAKPGCDLKKTPMNELLIAAQGGCADIVRLLIGAGSGLDEKGFGGETALHLACLYGHVETVEVLLEAGASLTIRNDGNQTPLGLAESVLRNWSGKNAFPAQDSPVDLRQLRRCIALLKTAGKKGRRH